MTRPRKIAIALTALVATAVAALSVTTLGQAQTKPTTAGSFRYLVRLGGVEGGASMKVTLPTTEHGVVESTDTDAQGRTRRQKVPGQLSVGDLILRRKVDSNDSLWRWRQEVIDGKFLEARTDGTITMVDWEGEVVASWSFVGGWPSRYEVTLPAPGVKGTAYEVLNVAVERFERN